MSGLRQVVRRLRNEEDGFSLVWLAIILVLLLGMLPPWRAWSTFPGSTLHPTPRQRPEPTATTLAALTPLP